MHKMYKNGTIIPYYAQEQVPPVARVKPVGIKLRDPITVSSLEPSMSLPMSAKQFPDDLENILE